MKSPNHPLPPRRPDVLTRIEQARDLVHIADRVKEETLLEISNFIRSEITLPSTCKHPRKKLSPATLAANRTLERLLDKLTDKYNILPF